MLPANTSPWLIPIPTPISGRPWLDPALVEPGDGPLHGERGAQRAVGVVGVGDRRAPERHDRVADELVERAAVLEDHLHHLA